MTTKCYAMVRGSVARFTLLDVRGRPVVGPSSVVVTKGVSTVRIDEVTETQSTQLQRTPYDKPRVLLRGKTQTMGYTADLALAGVDPDLLYFLTGQPQVANAAGDIVGNDSMVRLPLVNYAMEVWSKLDRIVDGYRYGYTLFPRIRGGRLSNFVFRNGAVDLSITGSRTCRNSQWGYGPHDLSWNGYGWDLNPWDTDQWDNALGPAPCEPPAELDDGFGVSEFGEIPFGGTPVDSKRLQSPVSRNLHWRSTLVAVAPVAACGVQGLYDSIDGGSAAFTSSDVVDGESVFTSTDVVDGGRA